MKLLWIGILAFLLLACESLPKSPFNDANTGVTLSPIMGNLPLIKKNNYSDPRLGIGYVYKDNNIAVCSLYIYNGGQTSILDGTKSVTVENEFERAKSAILTVGSQGKYQSLQELGTRTRVFGEIEYLESSFKFNTQDLEKYSYLFVTGFNNHFFKIRCTYLRQYAFRGENVVTQFLADLSKEINKRN